MAGSPSYQVAILDDYQGISARYFDNIKQAFPAVSIAHFTDTHNARSDSELRFLEDRLSPFEVIICMRERTAFPAKLLERLPKLKLLLTTGPKNAAIDLAQCEKQNIVVAGTYAPASSTKPKYPKPDTTTTHTWALILGLARHVARDHIEVVKGGWQGPTIATPISGKTLGLVGLGRLGSAVGRIAVQAWGMRVIAWSPNLTQERVDQAAKSFALDAGDFEFVDKATLFKEADVVSLHMVLSERSKGVIGMQELELMKKTALFVNTSRGPLVNEEALLTACKQGQIGGAALDVFDEEPLPADSLWRTEKWGTEGRSDVLLSPHMGYGQDDVINEWYRQNAENLQRWLRGEDVLAKF